MWPSAGGSSDNRIRPLTVIHSGSIPTQPMADFYRKSAMILARSRSPDPLHAGPWPKTTPVGGSGSWPEGGKAYWVGIQSIGPSHTLGSTTLR